MVRDLTRRDALRLGATTAGLGTLGSLAGCSSLPFVGGGSFEQWLPEPDELDTDHYGFNYLDSQTVTNNEGDFDEEQYDEVRQMAIEYRDLIDVDFADAAWMLTFESAAVIQGSFNNSDMVDELEQDDFEEETTYKGYTKFVGPDEETAAAVGNALLFSRSIGDNDADEAIEVLIDAKQGDVGRYVDESEDMNELVSQLAGGTSLSGRTGEGALTSVVASGASLTVDGNTSDITFALVFEGEEEAGDASDEIDDFVSTVESDTEIEDVSTEQSGRTILATGVVDTDEIPPIFLTGRLPIF